MRSHSERATYQMAAELGGLEILDASYHHQTFSRHTHEGYTVGVIENGAQRFLRNGSNHLAPRDSIILVNHDEVHDGHSATPDGWSYKALYPLPEQLLQVQKDAGLKEQGSVYFPEPVVHDPELAGLIRHTLQQLQTSDNRLLRETLLYSCLLQLMQRHGRKQPAPAEPALARQRMQLVKDFLDQQPQEDISLEALATLAGVSAFHLIRQFQRCFGLPPHAYQIQARIRLAKKLIRSGHSLLDSALKAGFHDQSHLNRHFRKALGITPGQYARQH